MSEPFIQAMVLPEFVEHYTSRGWEVVSIHESQVKLTDQITYLEPEKHGYTREVRTPIFGQGLYILMRRNGDSVLAESERRIRNLTKVLEERTNERDQARKHLEVVQRAHDAAQASLKALGDAKERNYDEKVVYQKRCNQMEVDLGKLRAAIGSKQMDEILKP